MAHRCQAPRAGTRAEDLILPMIADPQNPADARFLVLEPDVVWNSWDQEERIVLGKRQSHNRVVRATLRHLLQDSPHAPGDDQRSWVDYFADATIESTDDREFMHGLWRDYLACTPACETPLCYEDWVRAAFADLEYDAMKVVVPDRLRVKLADDKQQPGEPGIAAGPA